MMPTNSFTAVFLFSFSLAIGAVLAPGPVTTAIISQSPRLGWVTGLLVSIGHALLELVIVVLITLGLSGVLGASSVQIAIALLGGLLLLYMGGSMLIGAAKGKMKLPEENSADEKLSYGSLLTMGVVTSLSNPFWYAWWMTVAAAYLLEAKAIGWIIVAGFYFGHISADFVWNLLLSTVIGNGKKFLTNKIYAALISLCAGFLIYLAFKFLVTGYQGIVG
ncbi:MAG: LysE family transporter [Anaerolineaceae bacterium]|nr:LysE family transporter [Anaerolineaceae bacterium]